VNAPVWSLHLMNRVRTPTSCRGGKDVGIGVGVGVGVEGCTVLGVGFLQRLVIKVRGLRFRVQGLASGFWGPGSKAQGHGARVQGVGWRI